MSLKRLTLLLQLTLLLYTGSLGAEIRSSFGWAEYKADLHASRWEAGIPFAGITAYGLANWNWGSSNSFSMNPEGWFGEDTGSGGADKLGHAFTSYFMNNVIADRLIREGRTPQRAALSSALTTQAIMLYIEILDGFSDDHGFSYEDLIMNMTGSALAYARTVNPTFRDLVDFRMEYQPSGYMGFRPISDYSGQKYLLSLKLSGIAPARKTPLRFLELQTGYFTRGFSEAERDDGKERSRHRFVGIGLNLNELLFGRRQADEGTWKNYGRLFFEHIQIPNTSVRVDNTL